METRLRNLNACCFGQLRTIKNKSVLQSWAVGFFIFRLPTKPPYFLFKISIGNGLNLYKNRFCPDTTLWLKKLYLGNIMKTIESSRDYFDTKFINFNKSNKHFHNIEFESCDFVQCDFSSCTFSKCNFVNCRFSDCNLSLIKVPIKKINEVIFKNCKMLGVNWTESYWSSYKIYFEL